VGEHLLAIRRRLAETIIPAVSVEDELAVEQSTYVLRALDWLIEVHALEYRYEVVENVRYRRALTELIDLLGGPGSEERDDLVSVAAAEAARVSPRSDEAATPLVELTRSTRAMKDLFMELFVGRPTAGTPDDSRFLQLLQSVSKNQVELELALHASGEYASSDRSLAGVLGAGVGDRDDTTAMAGPTTRTSS
jgi:hypothetical protein